MSLTNEAFRSQVLSSLGAGVSEQKELLAYNENIFDHDCLQHRIEIPLLDEDFIAAWRQYAQEALEIGAFHVLQKAFVQFAFPIRKGISTTEGYLAVVRRGVTPDLVIEAKGLAFRSPERLKIFLNSTLVGHIPVIATDDRSDFETLVRAVTMRNEPLNLPPSMGAILVSGYNNWDRVRRYRREWESTHDVRPIEEQWQEEFSRIMPFKDRYQDRFIIFGEGPYSAVPAKDMELSEKAWSAVSRTIRLEHESTHYVTKRLFNSARSNLLDEMIADYFGIIAASGCYRADWFLRFMGLENSPRYREAGRLENYRGEPKLSDGAFRVLRVLIPVAARNLEHFYSRHQISLAGLLGKFLTAATLTQFTLEELASMRTQQLLDETLMNVQRKARISVRRPEDRKAPC